MIPNQNNQNFMGMNYPYLYCQPNYNGYMQTNTQDPSTF